MSRPQYAEDPITTTRRCSQCGATVDVPPDVRSTTCVFCESALVDDHADLLEPVDRVVPFTIDRDGAAGRVRAWLAGRWFAPESVRRAAKPDQLHDVLVPFYVFDAIARSRFAVNVGLYWYRTETYTVTVNGKKQTRTRQVRETEWFPLEGSHVRQWFDHLVSASRGLPEHEANALEPFDLGSSVPYAPVVVAGLVAERATVPRAEADQVARQELADLEQAVIADGHLPGDTWSGLQSSTVAELEPPRLVLLPVWVAVVRGPKGPVRVLVNGQSGEVVGRVPTSWAKVAGLVGLVLLLILALVVLFALVGAPT